MENDHHISKKAELVCKNFNQANLNVKLGVLYDAEEIAKFYKTYEGVTEFLYIAPQEEIQEAINSGATYFTIKCNNELAGIAKAAKLSLPYPFFYVPKDMDKNNDYWGLSGLYVHKKYRGKRFSTMLLNASSSLAQMCNANGIYADFDYRNIASMQLISKHLDFLGYTDGRKGSPDEATIYTTFFRDFTGTAKPHKGINFIFEQICAGHAKKTIDMIMEGVGPFTRYIVPYCEGYNEIVCFDTPYIFENTNIKVAADVTKIQKYGKKVDKQNI